jgi:hypothetical protein
MPRALPTLLLVTGLLIGSGTHRVEAQEPVEEPPPAEYMALIQEAVTASAAERWLEARSLFREAQRVYPNARALRGIGMTSFELSDYTGAYLALTAALAETRRSLDFEQRAQVEALLGRVRELIGRYTVAHLGDAPVVTVDAVRQEIQAEGYVLMTSGEHRVAVTLADGRRVTGSWIVRGGEVGPLPIELPSADLAPEAVAEAATELHVPASPVVQEPARDTRPLRLAGWVSISSGVALLAVGTGLTTAGRTDKAYLEGADPGTVWDEVEHLHQRSPRFVRGGSALIGLGGAAAIAGLGLMLRARGGGADQDSDDPNERAAAGRPSVHARVAPRGAQLEVVW